MAKYFLIPVIVALTAFSHTARAETEISGFGSIVAGVVTSGDRFLSDYPNVGIYDTDLSFAPDTSFGVQIKNSINDQTNFIIQLISRGASEYNTSIDWAYLNYQFDAELSIQAGRKRLPLYFYSDFYDLGMAYHWIRPPSDNYTWQIANYNGISLQYETIFNDWDLLLITYIGREDDDDNQLLSYLANNVAIDETWKNILGVVAELSNGQYELRFSVMSSQLDRHTSAVILADSTQQIFYGLSVNAFFNQIGIYSEFNRYERSADDVFVNTYMLSLTYRLDDYTPHITYSKLKQQEASSGGDELHDTISIGVKKELNKSAVLKLQYDKTRDQATNTTIVGDGELISFGIDFVF